MSSDTMKNFIYPLQSVKNEGISQRVRDLLKGVLDDDVKIRLDWLQNRNWIVQPVIYSIVEEDALQIVKAIREDGHNTCYAAWVRGRNLNEVFKVPISQKNIIAFDGVSHVYPMVLIPLNLSFLIFSNNDPEYHIIFGDPKFVSSCLRVSHKETRTNFKAEADLEDDVRKKLLYDVLNHYEKYFHDG